jgi:hypothetical protein
MPYLTLRTVQSGANDVSLHLGHNALKSILDRASSGTCIHRQEAPRQAVGVVGGKHVVGAEARQRVHQRDAAAGEPVLLEKVADWG